MRLLAGIIAVLWLIGAGTARAEPLAVADMRLAPDAAWRRGAPAQERESDAWLMEWPGGGGAAFHVVIPRQVPRLKVDAQAYYGNLGHKWQGQYGSAAAIGWIEAGGRKWLACRRPSRDKDAAVFHLSTVFEGRAYSLLVFAPPDTGALPRPALDLAAGARFGTEGQRWVLARGLRAQPAGAALEALMRDEAARLGAGGMLTGFGLEYDDAGMSWFMDGFRWQGTGAKAAKAPFALRGRLEAVAPAVAGDGLKLRLKLDAGETPLAARVRIHDLCASPAELEAAWQRLGQGEPGALAELARARPAACPETWRAAVPGGARAEPGRAIDARIELRLPPPLRYAQRAALGQAGLERVMLVEAGPQPAGGRLGDALLSGAGLFYLYRFE